MPTRYLKPGIRDSDKLDLLSALAETLFYRLLVTVDDFGRFDARPAMVKASCFPIKDSVTPKVCASLLAEMAKVGLIDIYEADGKPYLQVSKWDNQPRARASKFPAPSDGRIQVYAKREHVHTDVCRPRTLLPETETETGNRNREPRTENRNRNSAKSPISRAESSETWDSYSIAYQEKYGVQPVRNAKVNGQLSKLVGRLGANEAPGVARFYLSNRNSLYVAAKHCTDLLLRDCEKLRTEWVTGNVGHQRDAREEDRMGATASMVQRITEKLEAKGVKL